MDPLELGGPADVARLLSDAGYLCDEGLATAAFLCLQMQRPLLLEGESGTGKTAFAEALATATGWPLFRLQCYQGVGASQALYAWDFPRQILHLRSLEAVSDGSNVEDARLCLYDEKYLLSRPILHALRAAPAILLIDEVDRADEEFEALLLEVLSTYQVRIPELGTIAATLPPVVVLTSNSTREMHHALRRRCLYHWMDHPSLASEVAIVRHRVPNVSETLARQLVDVVHQLRHRSGLPKSPGLVETLDWARALERLGVAHLDVEAAAATVGTIVKNRENTSRVQAAVVELMTV